MTMKKATKGHIQPDTNPKAKVQQHHAASADLNQMMARHMAGPGRQGIPIGNPNATRQPRFLDLSSGDSYHDMLNRVTQIDTMFSRLPARLRGRFRNNPELLLRFAEDPANTKEAVKLGLIDDPEVIQAVLEAEQMDLEQEAAKAGETPQEPKGDSTPKGGTPPQGG